MLAEITPHIAATEPPRELKRLETLTRYRILDTAAEQCYDDLTQLASTLCGVPISLVSLVDRERQWFKSRFGLEVEATARELSFCAHAILEPEPAFHRPRRRPGYSLCGQSAGAWFASHPFLCGSAAGYAGRRDNRNTLCYRSRTQNPERRAEDGVAVSRSPGRPAT